MRKKQIRNYIIETGLIRNERKNCYRKVNNLKILI